MTSSLSQGSKQMSDVQAVEGLPHAVLTADMVPLLRAGTSVWSDPKWGPVRLDRFDDSRRRAFTIGLCDGEARLLVPKGAYLGEQDEKGWIHAPVGGWTSNPAGNRLVEFRVRFRPDKPFTDRATACRWDHKGWATDIIAFRFLEDGEEREGVDASTPEAGNVSGVTGGSTIPTVQADDQWAELERLASVAAMNPATDGHFVNWIGEAALKNLQEAINPNAVLTLITAARANAVGTSAASAQPPSTDRAEIMSELQHYVDEHVRDKPTESRCWEENLIVQALAALKDKSQQPRTCEQCNDTKLMPTADGVGMYCTLCSPLSPETVGA